MTSRTFYAILRGHGNQMPQIVRRPGMRQPLTQGYQPFLRNPKVRLFSNTGHLRSEKMAPKTLLSALRAQFLKIPDYEADLTDKTVVVVGANVGLGYEAAKKFAKMNPKKLILACRSQVKGDAAAKSIQEATGCSTVECWTVDLADFKTVSAFANRFEKEGGGRLDILLENAGVLNTKFISTVDGWENTLQVNHLGTSFLAILLLPHIARTPGAPRITLVSSEMQYWVHKLDEAKSDNILHKLNDPSIDFNKVIERYNITKLFNVFFARTLAERLKSNLPVSVNSMNPGYCASALHRNVPRIFAVMEYLFMWMFARTTEVGSRTLVHAALWGTKDDVNGRFLSDCRLMEESDYSISKEGKEVEARLWTETLEVLQKADPRVQSIVAEYLR